MAAIRTVEFCGFLVLSLLISACGGGGGDEPPPDDNPNEGAGWITIDTANVYPTDAYLAGEAFISPTWWRCCSGSAEDTGVTITWTNTATGATGPANQYVRYDCLLSSCWPSEHSWSANVPIITGANPIVMVASDPSGNIGRAFITLFPGPPPADTTPPSVISTSPVDAAIGVGVNTSITASFSETMDQTSIDSASFTLTDSMLLPVPGTISYAGTTATFDPVANLAYTSQYQVQIANTVRDLAGNTLPSTYTWTFTTGDAPDTTPPEVSSVNPQNNEGCVDPDTTISASFSEPIDGATANTSSFLVSNLSDVPVIGTVSPSGATVYFNSTLGLAYDTSYTATLTTAITDLAGNALTDDYTWRFTTRQPLVGSWQPITTTGAPLSRTGHTAIWTGTEMIVWGGDSIYGKLNTGGRYDPNVDAWQITATTGAPVARYAHTAVWTGSEMILWGGVDQAGNYLNSGARYAPDTNAWQALPTAGAPSPRRFHSAVWTGSEMLVWGGTAQDGTLLNDGARYNPATDSWQPITTLNSPSARTHHTAVWSGTEMLVWGGAGLSTNQGGRYDPAADSWLPMSIRAAPSSRLDHTAVWTGDRMVVWGGYDGSYAQSGGSYDPISDSWQATSLTCPPTGRAGHLAEWSGSRMLIWGGVSFGASLNSGAANEPSGGAWQAMNYLAAPPAMSNPRGVWTGTRLIVWGANALSSSPGSGGQFTPGL